MKTDPDEPKHKISNKRGDRTQKLFAQFRANPALQPIFPTGTASPLVSQYNNMTTGAQDDNDGDRAAAQDDVTREQDLLEEASVLAELVARVVRSDGAEAPAVHERFRQIVE